jgi:hypothetical protein
MSVTKVLSVKLLVAVSVFIFFTSFRFARQGRVVSVLEGTQGAI